jgi:hypothetical protein
VQLVVLRAAARSIRVKNAVWHVYASHSQDSIRVLHAGRSYRIEGARLYCLYESRPCYDGIDLRFTVVVLDKGNRKAVEAADLRRLYPYGERDKFKRRFSLTTPSAVVKNKARMC